ncbi:alpha-L-rhamnosidase-related protein [Aeoliella sp. SH292]|uniref:alpha-L-rhamnosidase-related protein n=1 Tax=Aeoliella sp. SH292 TaxID=3454464 RepID=UPI003F947F48
MPTTTISLNILRSFALWVGCIAAAVASAAPTELSCEFLTQPSLTQIYDPQPDFAWVVEESVAAQSAYHIEVRSAEEPKTSESPLVWDSGRVASGQSINIEYAGETLEPGGTYEWRVRYWGKNGQESDWSKPQVFRMASELESYKTSVYPVAVQPKRAVAAEKRKDNTYFVDFGQAAFGHLTLQFPRPTQRDAKLGVHFGERLDGGRIDRAPGGTIRYYRVEVEVPAGTKSMDVRPPQQKQNTSGQAILLPESIGVIAPFRYVEAEGLPQGLSRRCFVQQRVEYPFDDNAADFQCSDSRLNAVWDLCKYSIRATTFCGIYVDGDRERIPYEADAYINQLSHYCVDREYALARHSHEYLLENPTWPTEWKQHSVLMAWEDYQYTGDTESLESSYDVLKHQKLLSDAERPDGLLDTSQPPYRDIVDWPAGERDGYDFRPVNTVVNSFHYITLRRMADIARALGKNTEAKEFGERADKFATQFNRQLWDAAELRYVDGLGSDHSAMHASLFPLAFGLVPEERVPPVTQLLAQRGMACSVYPAQFLLEGLYANDQDQHALDLMTSDSQRSWMNMIRVGSTIALEAWDQEFKPNLDWNHAWGAAPANIIPRYLVGVRPAKPGFEAIDIQPRPGYLEWFEAKVPTIRGAVHVHYRRTAAGYTLKVSVPGNTTAQVELPMLGDELPGEVVCDGSPIEAPINGSHWRVTSIGSGSHVFQVKRKSEMTVTCR